MQMHRAKVYIAWQNLRADGSSANPFELKPEELLGRTTLLPIEEDDTRRSQAKILEIVEEYEGQLEREPDRIKFRAKKIGGINFKKLIDYNIMMCDLIEEQVRDENRDWAFLEIDG